MSGQVSRWQQHARDRALRQQVALAKPMNAIPLAGDPCLMPNGGKDYTLLDPAVRTICLYASAVMRKRGALPLDASAIDARFVPPSTVIFVVADESQAEVCRLTVQLADSVDFFDSEDDDG